MKVEELLAAHPTAAPCSTAPHVQDKQPMYHETSTRKNVTQTRHQTKHETHTLRRCYSPCTRLHARCTQAAEARAQASRSTSHPGAGGPATCVACVFALSAYQMKPRGCGSLMLSSLLQDGRKRRSLRSRRALNPSHTLSSAPTAARNSITTADSTCGIAFPPLSHVDSSEGQP